MVINFKMITEAEDLYNGGLFYLQGEIKCLEILQIELLEEENQKMNL